MRDVVLTPYDRQDAVQLSGTNRWRKQLLPIGDVKYKGRVLSFTREYLAELARAFKEQAFDIVPFQFATESNKHTNDPERFRGSVVGMELTDSGLDVLLEPTEEGEKVLQANPHLGVSARIYENYTREADGKHWLAAIQHVLGTLDPHIPGMAPWQKVAALANEAEISILDLTAAEFETDGEEEGPVALNDDDKTALRTLLRKVRDSKGELTDQEIDQLIEESAADAELGDEAELTDEELDALIEEAERLAADEGTEEEVNEEVDEEEEKVGAEMSANTVAAIELANAELAEQRAELSRVTAELDEQAFVSERTRIADKYGIPPRITDLARPLLEGRGHVVELAGGDQVDAGKIVRDVFTEFGKLIKVLDLSGEIGNGVDPGDSAERDQANRETHDFVAQARKQFDL